MAQNVREYETRARELLARDVWDFFAGGAGDERTLLRNEAAFGELGLVPRVLRAAGEPDPSVELLGERLSMPVVVAPTAFHRLATPEGEVATARAARRAGTVMILSMASTTAVEEVAAAAIRGDGSVGPGLWFQLYLHPDRGFTRAVAERAVSAGCRALVLTVDSPVFGRRERDARNGFHDLPDGLECPNMRDPEDPAAAPRSVAFDPDAGWEDVEWLRGAVDLPLVLKGVLHPEDARLALESGVAGLYVSNHGGRQLDGGLATVELLADVVDAVEGRLPVLLDGGLRRGTDVVKALALGADAVALGRPLLWGLAAAGERGASDVLELLRRELRETLALCGVSRPAELRRDLLRSRGTVCSSPSSA